MDKASVVQYFGTEVATAKALGMTRQGVYYWPDSLPKQSQDRVYAYFAKNRRRVPANLLKESGG
jgi:predicted DCC family thiol-disulfide oxidoreductase YuxK